MVLCKLYLKDFSILNGLSSEYAKVLINRNLNMLYLRVLNEILDLLHLTGFWIYHSFKICQYSKYFRVLNVSGFIKKTLHHIDAWQSSDYSLDSAYTLVLNMLGVTQDSLKKWYIMNAWQDSKYSLGSEHVTVLNM